MSSLIREVPRSSEAEGVTPLLPKTAVLPLIGEITLPLADSAVYDYIQYSL